MALGLLVAAMALQGSPDLSKRVTYETVAVPVARAVAEISSSTGVKLLTADPMSDQVVVLRFDNLPLSEALPRIAKVTSGRWVTQSGAYVLQPDNGVRQQQQESEANDRLKEAKAAIKTRLEEEASQAKALAKAKSEYEQQLKKDPKGAASYKEQNLWPDSNPLQIAREKLMQEVVSGLDPQDLAAIPFDGRLVYSSEPTPMQKGIGSMRPETLDTFIRIQNEERAKEKRNADDQAQGGTDPGVIENLRAYYNEPLRHPSKVLVVVYPVSGDSGTFSLEIRFYDSNGKVTYLDRDNLSSDSEYDSGEPQAGANPDDAKQSKNALKSTSIQYSTASRQIAKLREGIQSYELGLGTLSDEVLQKLQRPDLFDPLSFGESEAILAVAKEGNEQVAAELPDDFHSVGPMSRGPTRNDLPPTKTSETNLPPSTAAARDDWANSVAIEVKEGGGWLEITPSNPTEHRLDRADRASLARFIQVGDDRGFHSISDYGEVALRCKSPSESAIVSLYMSAFSDRPMVEQWGSQWEAYRFYGMLNSDQRAILDAGGKLPVRRLGEEQLRQVRSLVFFGDRGLELAESAARTKPVDSMQDLFADEFIWGGENAPDKESYLDEPTEALPNGIPDDASIDSQIAERPIAKPVAKHLGVYAMVGAFGPAEFAAFKLSANDPDLMAMGNKVPKLTKFKVGVRHDLRLTFHLTQRSILRHTLSEDRVPKGTLVADESALPADFLKLVADATKALKDMHFNERGRSGNPETPPPL